MGKIIGIDLGTTNSCCAVMVGGKPEVIPSAEGNRTVPSIVAFKKDGERLVGEPAKRQAVSNSERTIRSIKRKMGTDYRVTIDDNTFTPEEISAMILQKIKADAEDYLGEKVDKAVITVPAYFNDNQRKATKDAGTIAGLEVQRIINEPTASTLAYGLDKSEGENILIYDLGGGTFDVSILEVGDGVFEVLSTSGDTHLGGDDWDQALMNHLVETFKKEQGIDLSKDKMAMQRLKEASEKAKIELSTVAQTNVNLPYITASDQGPKHLDVTISRAQFQNMTRDLLEKTRAPIHTSLKDAKLDADEIDKVILVGGSTRMPAVVDLVKSIFNQDPYKNINPDECVAIGAAIQGGVLTGEVEDLVLLDVTPLTLGIETLGGIATPLIERNTTIPTKKSKIFTTAADNQPSVEVHVVQGERKFARDNISLGRFHLTGIPPAPRGVPQIEVTFDIDANGIVNVSAKDLGTGNEQQITITGTTNLSDSEIENKVEDAQKYAEEDKKRQEKVEVMNQADSLVYSTERLLEDMKDKITEENKKAIEEGLKDLKEAIETDDVEKVKEAMDALNKKLHEASQAIYQKSQEAQQQAQQQAGQGQGPGPGQGQEGNKEGDDYVDADYKIVDEE